MTRSAEEALVARLLAVISGDAPVAEATRLLAPDVVSHMDRHTVRGTEVWFDWLEFLRSRAGGAVKADVDRFVTHPDGTVTALGTLRTAGAVDGARGSHEARYRVAGGRVVEIWTTRGNYEMIFGPVRHAVRWPLVLLEFAIWRRLPGRRRTRSSRDGGGAG